MALLRPLTIPALGWGMSATMPRALRPPRCLAKPLPKIVVGDAEIDPAVGRLEGLVGNDGRVLVAAPAGWLAGRKEDAGIEGEERSDRLVHGDAHVLAEPSGLARVEGCQDALRRVEARDEIADRHADLVGRSIARPGEIHDAGFPLHDDVIAGPVLLEAGVAETRNRAIDHGGATRPHRRIAEAQAVHCAGARVLDQHVRNSDQAPEHLLARFALHVERHAFLVAVDGEEIGRLITLEGWGEGARVVAFPGAFHLDHLGAEVAQLHGAVGPREHPREVHDAKSFQRTHSSSPFHPPALQASLGPRCQPTPCKIAPKPQGTNAPNCCLGLALSRLGSAAASHLTQYPPAAGLHGPGARGQYSARPATPDLPRDRRSQPMRCLP